MTRRTEVAVTCDLPHEQEAQADTTMIVEIDGRAYKADACTTHAEDLREALAPFVLHARRVTRRPVKRRTTAHRRQSAEKRAWARDQGYDVPDRGRLREEIVEQYRLAH